MEPDIAQEQAMYWPFKTTIAFRNDGGEECRLTYAVSAGDMIDAKCEMERRLNDLGIFSYTIETIVAATNREADRFNLPAGCVQLLGY
jgi:hypothetical protein